EGIPFPVYTSDTTAICTKPQMLILIKNDFPDIRIIRIYVFPIVIVNKSIMLGIEIIDSSVITTHPYSAGNVFVESEDGRMIQPAYILWNLDKGILSAVDIIPMEPVKSTEPDIPFVIFHKITNLLTADTFRRTRG